MRIGLFAPPSRDAALAIAAGAAAYLSSAGAEVFCEREAQHMLPQCRLYTQADALDALVCIGGDGTLLHAVPFAVRYNAPVLGINMGSLGFLAETDPNRLTDALSALLKGSYRLEERPLLRVSLAGDEQQEWLALNDLVLIRGSYPRLVSAVVSVGGEEIERLRADGLIVATPTGSTGYALSSGGPIIAPGVDCILLSAVCAHSLTHRPTLLPGDAVIEVALRGDHLMRVILQTDGVTQMELGENAVVRIERSTHALRLIHVHDYHFFDTVRAKLTGHGRGMEEA